MERTPVTPQKPDRKTIERNRRIHMKGLIYKLTSLVPPQHFRPSKVLQNLRLLDELKHIESYTALLSQQDQLDQVAAYIKQLREKVEKLKKRKQEAVESTSGSDRNIQNSNTEVPIVKVRDVGSSIEVIITSAKTTKLALHEIVKILQEEGTEVISANISTVGDNVFHILHAQVKVSRIGVDTSMICDRFRVLISGFTSN